MLTYNLIEEKNVSTDRDPLYGDVVKLVQEIGIISASLIQRHLKLGYARSAKLLDELEQNGIIGPANGSKPREILIPHKNRDGEFVTPPSPSKIEIINEKEPEPVICWHKTKYADNKSDLLEIKLGFDENNNPVNLDLEKYGNLFIFGSQFMESNQLINNILVDVVSKYSPEELKLVVADGIRGDLLLPNLIPHLLTPIIYEPEKVISALRWGVSEIERRLKTLMEVGAIDYKKWNQNKNNSQKMPAILFVINSIEQIRYYSPSEIEDNLFRLFNTGRKVGIYFIIEDNYPNLKDNKIIMVNNVARVAFKQNDKNFAKNIKTPESTELNSPNQAILNVIFEENKKILVEKINHKKIYEEIFE